MACAHSRSGRLSGGAICCVVRDSSFTSKRVACWASQLEGVCRVLLNLIGSHGFVFGESYELVICDHSGATAVWHVRALESGLLAFIRFLFVKERGAVGYYCFNLRIGHGRCGVIIPLLSGVQRRFDYGFA